MKHGTRRSVKQSPSFFNNFVHFLECSRFPAAQVWLNPWDVCASTATASSYSSLLQQHYMQKTKKAVRTVTPACHWPINKATSTYCSKFVDKAHFCDKQHGLSVSHSSCHARQWVTMRPNNVTLIVASTHATMLQKCESSFITPSHLCLSLFVRVPIMSSTGLNRDQWRSLTRGPKSPMQD